MAVSKEIVYGMIFLALGAFVGAIVVTVVAQKGCSFMLDTGSKCLDYQGYVFCCNCCDLNNSSCFSKCDVQNLQGFGFTMIVLFWTIFVILASAAGILYSKMRKGEERAQLLD